MDQILDTTFPEDEQSFTMYRAFDQIVHIQDIINILQQEDIPYRLESSNNILDSAIVGNALYPKNILKLLPKDFKKVNQLIEKQILDEGIVPEDHYLWDFLEEELHQVVLKPEEWSVEDQAYAKILLEKKGIKLDQKVVEEQIETRLSEIRIGKQGNTGWMIFYLFGSILGVILFSPFFVVMGLGMGWYYWKGTNVDPYGKRYPVFDPNTQFWGKIIFYTGLITLALSVALWIIFDFHSFALIQIPNLF